MAIMAMLSIWMACKAGEQLKHLCLIMNRTPTLSGAISICSNIHTLCLATLFPTILVHSAMATQVYCNDKEWKLFCEDSVNYPGVKHSRNLGQMVRRRRGRGEGAEPNAGPVPSPSLEGRDKTPIVGLYPSEDTESRTLDPIQGIRARESSTAPAVFESNSHYPVLSFSVDKQPPAEIRTNRPLPPITVSLKRLVIESDDESTLDVNNLWGQASLVSADGRIAMAQFRVDILTGGSLVAPLLRSHLRQGKDNLWVLRFRGLVICEPGFFKIRIALIGTSENDGQSHGSVVVDAPIEQLSVDTRLIRVHAFAAAWRGTGK